MSKLRKPLYFKASVLVNAARDTVWQVLTEPRFTAMWLFNCEPETDWAIGSPLSWRGRLDGTVYVSGKVLRFEPPALLSFTSFNPNGAYPDTPENHLETTFTLKSVREGTELTIAQGDFSGLTDAEERFQDAEGWQSVLEGIREVVEECMD